MLLHETLVMVWPLPTHRAGGVWVEAMVILKCGAFVCCHARTTIVHFAFRRIVANATETAAAAFAVDIAVLAKSCESCLAVVGGGMLAANFTKPASFPGAPHAETLKLHMLRHFYVKFAYRTQTPREHCRRVVTHLK